jgi:hypothetical protein
MRSRRHSTVATAALVAGMTLLSFPVLSATSGAANAHVSKSPTLVSLVVAGPSGFKSEPTDPSSGDHTGRVTLAVATSAECDPTALSPGQWVATVLRYFDKDAARPAASLILCVTQLRTTNDAAMDRARILNAIGSSAVRLKDIPGAYLHSVGDAEEIFFAKGDYFVRVVSADVEGTAMGLTLGQNLTQREYNRLPK